YLFKTQMQPEKVLYVSSQNASTISPAFANRLEYSKEEKKIVITLHKLRKSDSGVYVCVLKNSHSLLASGSDTMMLIEGTSLLLADCGNRSWVIYGLIMVAALLFSALVYCTFHRVDMKKYFQKEKTNTVYEDMSYSSRRSTLVRT
ncbi:CD7 protein, partial [Pedionomus torquatus]|nr:CD7 protein [Pedionomus torquatus]